MAVSDLTRKEVSALYIAFFNRAPERDGLAFWTDVFAPQTAADGSVDAAALIAIAGHFSRSAEAQASLPWNSDQALVNLLYTNILGRTPNEEGIVPAAGGGGGLTLAHNTGLVCSPI